MIERTLALIKPDAVAARRVGAIITMIEKAGFVIVALEKKQLNRSLVSCFYEVHKDKPFFDETVAFMISGPVIALVLEKEDAVKEWRSLMGATDPSKALPGTIRNLYGVSIGNNAVHGSDSQENACAEIALIFPQL
ncbi:MAG: nucleoside-diphosphate kinase [Candidatus Babeliales bacterium]